MRSVLFSSLAAVALVVSAADVKAPNPSNRADIAASSKGTALGKPQPSGANLDGKDIVPFATAQKNAKELHSHTARNQNRPEVPNGN
jgi:hypothetical protein